MTGLPWLNHSLWFPPPNDALEDPNGLLCAGGDLKAERLIQAYKQGIFPWYCADQPILWWSPDPRCILRFNDLHIAKSMRRTLNDTRLSYTFDQYFQAVVKGCAQPRPYSEGTWITNEMIDAYCNLHQQGVAHSIEVWYEGELAGGLYGVSIGPCFFGESMFGRKPNVSKYAFIRLAQSLEAWGYRLFDCQVPNDHLLSLGATLIPRSDFLDLLKDHLDNYGSQLFWNKN